MATTVLDPPTTFFGRLRRIGPGIIISGAIVGSGELIATTRLGAEVGFALLWLILFSCVVKVFLQIELGRYVVSSGHTVLEAFDRVPGPAVRVRHGRINWLNVLWALMTVGAAVQIGGILLALAKVFDLSTLGQSTTGSWLGAAPDWLWAIAFAVLTIGLLATGRYRFVEGPTTALVTLFTLSTLVAAILVQTTDAAIRGEDVATGLTPSIPSDGIVTAFAVLGITGVGANELVFYPYWCLEKGYARHVGPADGSPEWIVRARGWIRVMQLDAWIACAVYTTGTVAFYLLGAAILHRNELEVDGDALHESLSVIYTTGLGQNAGTWIYAAGAVAVLFSTFFVWAASTSRVLTDAVHVFGMRQLDDRARRGLIRAFGIGLPIFACSVALLFDEPVTLVFVGGIAQAAILPFLALAVCLLRYRATRRELAQRSWVDPALWIAVISTGSIGVYKLLDTLGVLPGTE